MKLLLIQPPNCLPLMDRFFMFEPLALEYLGAGAKLDGHEVRIVDARIEPAVEDAAREFAPDVIGLTAVTSQVNIVKDMAADLRKLCPDVLLAVGGHHATVRPGDFAGSEFDVVVAGEGVVALREILRATGGLAEVRGLGLRDGDGLIFTGPRVYTDLNALPVPDRTLTARYRKQYFSEWFKPLASIRTSLGCTARCTFCALWSITGGKYLRRDPDAVVEELAGIEEPNVFFCDDESMCDWRRMDALAEKIRNAGIRKRYFLYARADTVVRHPELFAKWARIGLAQVFVGLEDYSDARLAAMRKGLDTEQQERAIRILEGLGVMVYASFMVDPDYTREDFRALKAYVRKLRLQYATFTVLTPLPGTKLREAKEPELITQRPELCDMIHTLVPTRLPMREFYQELSDLCARAVPLHRSLAALLKFGLHGLLQRLRVSSAVLRRIRLAYLDYEEEDGAGQRRGAGQRHPHEDAWPDSGRGGVAV